MSRAYRPVIFDLDGVLIDSEALAWSAWREVLEPFGVTVTEDDVLAFTGRSFADEYAHFRRAGMPDEASMSELLFNATGRQFEAHLEAFDDAFDTVEALHSRNVPTAVASSSFRDRLDLSLTRTDLANWFAASAAGDEVERGKPAPDVYLLAAERLGVAPDTCVAVEDTQIGVEAAAAAGMLVVGIQRGAAALRADLVVPRLTPACVLHELGTGTS